MGFLATKFFWGGLLVCWGLVLIIEKIINVNIPFMRFVFAFILIYGGVYLITRNSRSKNFNIKTNVFNTHQYSNENAKEYNVVFGSSIIDLSAISESSELLKVNTVFGSSEIYLAEDINYDIHVNTVFGETVMPDRKGVNFGSNNYNLGDGDNSAIPIEINTVFGQAVVKLKTIIKNEKEDE